MKTVRIKFSRSIYKDIGVFVFIVVIFTSLTYPITSQINRGDIILYILFSFCIWFTGLIVSIKDLIIYRKIGGVLFILFFIIINIISAYYLIQVALTSDNHLFKTTIFFFMGLFYGTFL